MKTSWNDEEDDALQGLPLRAQIIYLRGIRRYMDYSTRITGDSKRRISLRMLAEIAHEEVNKKMKGLPTKDAVVASIDQLKRVGLIERIPDEDYLIFFLPKADVLESVKNNNTTTTLQQHYRDNTTTTLSEYADCTDGNTATTLQQHYRDNTTHQVSGIRKDITAYAVGEVEAESSVINIATKRKPPPPYQEIVDAYHKILPSLSQVYKLSETRKKRIKALWVEELDDLNCWNNYFKSISFSDFLMGRIPPINGRAFIADFDFIINPTNFIKIAEEKYHGKKIQR